MAYRRKPWVAKVVFNGKQVQIGTFDTQAEAEAAEDAFREQYHLPKTRQEIAAKAHKTLRRLGTYRNQHTKGRQPNDVF